MMTSQGQHRQRQLLLALLLFLVGQLALALHTHDFSLHKLDTEKCVVCLVSPADTPAPLSDIPKIHFLAEHSHPLPELAILVFLPQQTPSQPRAPPLS